MTTRRYALEPGPKTRIGGTPIGPDSPLSRVAWKARWLRDPVFEGTVFRELIHPGRREDLNGDIQNVHTLFRREFDIPGPRIRQARLYITADDCYKLYINGEFIGLGPAPAGPFDYFYNAWDVTASLRPGKNCIGVHAFYQGMHSLTFCSADNLAGLLVQLELAEQEGAGGRGSDEDAGRAGRQRGDEKEPDVRGPSHQTLGPFPSSFPFLVSDETWRCLKIDAYPSRHVIGYQTAFSEDIDLRKLPVGWTEPGYDDAAWQRPLSGDIPDIYTLSPQRTPPVEVYHRPPQRVVRKGPGHYFIDFGTELSGETAFRVSGKAGHEVEVRHGEELLEPETVRYDMRCNCLYQEFCTLSGSRDELLTFFDYKAFRYAEVLNWPEELSPDRVWAHERHYPFPEDAAEFSSSDPLLDDIWRLCRNGARVGTIDTYLDCPTREKGGFMGDGFVTGISHLVLTGDARIMRKFLKDIANTQYYCEGLSATAPNYLNGSHAEYSLLWPVLLEYYYQWTADSAFVREMMPVLERQLVYFAEYENESGLLADMFARATGKYAILVDWPKNLRDGYDDPNKEEEGAVQGARTGVVNTMLQGFYLWALEAAARLAEIAGSAGISEHVNGRPARVRAAVRSRLRDPQTGLFVDSNGSTHSALHANVTPLMSGILRAGEHGPVIDLIRRKRLSCGVYFSFFVLKALYKAGEADLAYDIMTGHDLHSWHTMLEAGATTCMEAWAPDLKWNTSWCHPWSSAPVAMIAHELMGLRPAVPGWKEVRFAPQVPEALESVSLRITIPQGFVEASFEQNDGRTTYRLSTPESCRIRCAIPGTAEEVIAGGKHALDCVV